MMQHVHPLLHYDTRWRPEHVTKSLDLHEKMSGQIYFDTHQAVSQIWLGFGRQGPTRRNTSVDFISKVDEKRD